MIDHVKFKKRCKNEILRPIYSNNLTKNYKKFKKFEYNPFYLNKIRKLLFCSLLRSCCLWRSHLLILFYSILLYFKRPIFVMFYLNRIIYVNILFIHNLKERVYSINSDESKSLINLDLFPFLFFVLFLSFSFSLILILNCFKQINN